ncbi:hypothetical protein [Nocardioides sp. zg-1230]|uniref:hypothetical protein n=1 Tax=Nocardioides sp. zg-1230 TaxID=2736601 RepID=UPI001553B8D9|nr:hypothetical protein [Nocardioides sp. zg-1230]NPC44555.1 hypothetical protein [Nocardioides sp. zg-1230]
MRIAVALAIFKAECAALDAGLSLPEVQAQDWLVVVEGDEAGSRRMIPDIASTSTCSARSSKRAPK